MSTLLEYVVDVELAYLIIFIIYYVYILFDKSINFITFTYFQMLNFIMIKVAIDSRMSLKSILKSHSNIDDNNIKKVFYDILALYELQLFTHVIHCYFINHYNIKFINIFNPIVGIVSSLIIIVLLCYYRLTWVNDEDSLNDNYDSYDS